MTIVRRKLCDVIPNATAERVRNNLDGTRVERVRHHRAEEATRTTVEIKLRVTPGIKERVDRDSAHYLMDRSLYVSHLIAGQPIPAPVFNAASDELLLTINGHALTKSIRAVTERLGEPLTEEVLAELRVIRLAVVQGQLSLKDAYNARISKEFKQDRWDGSNGA